MQIIFLPQDNDSTFSRLVNAESSFLTMDVTDRKLDKLKMWPEVTGATTPLFIVKPSQHFLPGFQWYESIRPRREWYGDRWHWDDNLGEVSEELELYFNAPAENIGRRLSSLADPAQTLPATDTTLQKAGADDQTQQVSGKEGKQ